MAFINAVQIFLLYNCSIQHMKSTQSQITYLYNSSSDIYSYHRYSSYNSYHHTKWIWVQILDKVCINLGRFMNPIILPFQLWVNSRIYWALWPCHSNWSRRRKTMHSHHLFTGEENWPCVASWGGDEKYIHSYYKIVAVILAAYYWS